MRLAILEHKHVRLKEEGFNVVLVNSNPATIMTDPELDSTYIEPLNLSTLEKLLLREACALLSTMGQTALNLAIELETKYPQKNNVKLIGASKR